MDAYDHVKEGAPHEPPPDFLTSRFATHAIAKVAPDFLQDQASGPTPTSGSSEVPARSDGEKTRRQRKRNKKKGKDTKKETSNEPIGSSKSL